MRDPEKHRETKRLYVAKLYATVGVSYAWRNGFASTVGTQRGQEGWRVSTVPWVGPSTTASDKMPKKLPLVFLVLAILATTSVAPARAQDDEQDRNWSDTAELTVVLTSGNAAASTLGFKNELTLDWESADLVISVGALRTESTAFTRTAVGTSPVSFQVTKGSDSALTAESYYARGQYDHDISECAFWYAGAGWERNTFAGFSNRSSVGGGFGNTWVDDDRATFKTAYGLTATRQDNLVGIDTTSPGLRLSYGYRQHVTSNTEITSVLMADENLDETGDFRTDFINAVAVSMTSQLALKVSWQLLYDRQPSLIELPLFGAGGMPIGDTVFATLDTVDNLLTFALVASF